MANVNIIARRLHRWLAYLVFAQLAIWVVGGLTFAVIPFDSVIKGGDSVQAPSPPTIKPEQLRVVADFLAEDTAMSWASHHQSSLGPVAKITTNTGTQWLALNTGRIAEPVSQDAITRFAQSIYTGSGSHMTTRYLTAVESRFLGLVDELYGRTDVWQVAFDDTVGTRLYFDNVTGVYLTVRNDFWVFYDAMWRLHIMDYSTGEDFNNPLLRIFTPLTFLFVVSGIILTWLSARRVLLRRRYTA